MENRTLQYYLQSLMPQETLPEEVEDQIHTCFSDDEIAEYESRLPKLDYWKRYASLGGRDFSRGRIPSTRMP